MVPDHGIFVVADGMGGHAAGEVASEMAVRFVAREQAGSHPYSNVITRCVGANSDVMPDIYLGTVKPTDLFLLASDGLTGMLEDPRLAELLAGKRVPQDQVDDLIAEANRHGGLDKITAINLPIEAVGAPVGGTTP